MAAEQPKELEGVVHYSAEQYEKAKRAQDWRKVQTDTLFGKIGVVQGLKIVDMGCGNGDYTRELADLGATVTGVDSSREFLDRAEKKTPADKYGENVAYVLEDARDYRGDGKADMVLGAWIFNYMKSYEDALALAKSIASCLKDGGRFVGVNDNGGNVGDGKKYKKYGFERQVKGTNEGDEIHWVIDGLVDKDGKQDKIVNFYLKPETLIRAFAEAGMDLHIEPWSENDVTRANPDHWKEFLNDPPAVCMVATKRPTTASVQPATTKTHDNLAAVMATTEKSEETETAPAFTQPLSDVLYDDVFNGAFVPNSAEYTDPATGAEGPMLYETRRILAALEQCKSIMSVGTGTGFFDGKLMAQRTLDRYLAIEPNPKHAEQIAGNTAKAPWDNKAVVQTHFDQSFTHADVQEGTFDAALWTHCAYFMKNLQASIEHQLDYLSPEGAMVILHQSETGVCEFFRHFAKQLKLQWEADCIRQDHSMSTANISEELKQQGTRHFIGEQPAHLYVDEFHQEGEAAREQALKLVSFFLNTDANQFSTAEQDEMIAWVREKSVPMNGRQALMHPQGFVVVPHPKNTSLKIDGMEEVA